MVKQSFALVYQQTIVKYFAERLLLLAKALANDAARLRACKKAETP
jgi:hypothetical protein